MNRTGDGTNAEHSSVREMRGEIPEQQEVPVGASTGVFLGDLERAVAQLQDQARELQVWLRDLELEIERKK